MTVPYTIADIRAAYANGKCSATDFLQERWSQLRELNERARDPAWICLATPEQLQAQLTILRQLDPRDCPLYGVPFAIKDNIDVAGWTTTAACPAFAYVAERTAFAVEQLQRAGAVLLGKTNLDQFATGLVGTRSPYGTVPNAFSEAHIGGGSSSGSASVVARGLVAFTLGTDTAGSGRVPAGFNNLMGCKPTPGAFSIEGVVPACKTLDCVSLLTLTAADAATVFAVIAGSSALGQQPTFGFSTQLRYAFPPRPRVGVLRDPFFVSEAYRSLYEASCRHLARVHCDSASFDFAAFAEAASYLYNGPWVAERHAVAGTWIERGAPGLDPVVAGIIGSAKRYSAIDAFNALYRVHELKKQTQKVWDELDLLMLPTAPNLPTIDDVIAEPVRRNDELGTYTNFVNLLGLSAFAVPFGFTDLGLPFGVTFIAPGGSDWALIELAARWQRSLNLPLGAHLRALQAADTTISSTPPRSMPLAVVGAHLSGMPLHPQLIDLGARLRETTTTASRYRLYALEGTVPAKPGLVRSEEGTRIEVEVYDVPREAVGRFLAAVVSPLGLGRIELQDGRWVTGFICEPYAVQNAKDITAHGGWRNYLSAGVSTSLHPA